MKMTASLAATKRGPTPASHSAEQNIFPMTQRIVFKQGD